MRRIESSQRADPRSRQLDPIPWDRLCAQAQVLLSSGAWNDAHALLWEQLEKRWGDVSISPPAILALGLVLTSCTHLDHKEHLLRGASWLSQIRDAGLTMSPEGSAYCIYHMARRCAELGKYAEARRLLSEAAFLGSADTSPWPTAYAQMVLTRVCVRTGDLVGASSAALEASVLAARSGSDVLLADALINLGSVSRFRRDYDSAQRLYARAASSYWRAGDFAGRSIALVNRASLLNGMGLLAASRSVFLEAREASAFATRQSSEMRAQLGLGWVYARSGLTEKSRHLLLSAWRQARRLELPREEALALEYLSESYILSGRLPQARASVRLCSRLARRIAPEGDIALEIKIKEGMLRLAEGNYRSATARALDAVRHARKVAMRWEEAQAHRVVGVARLYSGQKKQRVRTSFASARDLLSHMGEKLESRIVEAWLEALDRPSGWLPKEAMPPIAENVTRHVEGDDLQSQAIHFWLEHPLLGPHSWLRGRAGVATRPNRPSGAVPPAFSAKKARPSQRSAPVLVQRPAHPIWSDLGFVSRTPHVIELLHLAETYARGSIPVLILGETGTGKDLIAQGLHTLSGRQGRFVPINCAAAHRELFVAELFGARRGAYTGAAESRHGLIREAEGGTLFLDEIADLDSVAQGYLLRFLDSGEVRPLGESRSFRVETRVVAATCRDLSGLVKDGRLRRDLYARLAAAVLRLPPLRERIDDIEPLIGVLWKRAHSDPNDRERAFTPAVFEALRRRAWPGNVRDLAHLVAQTVLFVQAGQASRAVERVLEQAEREWDQIGASPAGAAGSAKRAPWVEALPPLERRSPSALRRALREAEGSIPRAARILGISRSHAYRRYEEFP